LLELSLLRFALPALLALVAIVLVGVVLRRPLGARLGTVRRVLSVVDAGDEALDRLPATVARLLATAVRAVDRADAAFEGAGSAFGGVGSAVSLLLRAVSTGRVSTTLAAIVVGLLALALVLELSIARP
jgi:hypothetical protein